ncbi:hypothetical protein FRC17_003927, partial [Serendipita sp. 399]
MDQPPHAAAAAHTVALISQCAQTLVSVVPGDTQDAQGPSGSAGMRRKPVAAAREYVKQALPAVDRGAALLELNAM